MLGGVAWSFEYWAICGLKNRRVYGKGKGGGKEEHSAWKIYRLEGRVYFLHELEKGNEGSLFAENVGVSKISRVR